MCVFTGSLFVLVNGSPMEEINISRGFKQGDPLAPFLFLLLAECLGGLVRSTVDRNRFMGTPLMEISHLQYSHDTLLIGEVSVENLWTLKSVPRTSELVSGLRIDFWKS